MQNLIDIFKGAMIGIANIIPGVSGGTLAVVMGIYDKLINAVSSILKEPVKAIKGIWLYAIGMILGVGSSILGVSYLLETYPVVITLLFVGLIVGAIPLIIGEVDKKKIETKDVIVFSVMMLVTLLLPFIGEAGVQVQIANENFIILMLVGLIAAGTMVLPGISGSMVLMALGYYKGMADIASQTIKAMFKFDLQTVFTNCLVIIPFVIGIVIGIILIAKLVKWLFEHYKKMTYWAILGLVVASPFPVLLQLNIVAATKLDIILGIVLFVFGIGISNWVAKIGK